MLKKILPPSLVQVLTGQHSSIWKGNYPSWSEAQNQCTGYDAHNIFEKVKLAALKVKAGEAVYEQDGVLFYKENYSWPLLSGLLLAAACNQGKLSVLDFGGALGSTYYQHRKYLNNLPLIKWNVIDQPEFVQFGAENLQNDALEFYLTAQDCITRNGTPLVLIISTTLPYLEDPYKMLRSLLALHVPFIIIDNTVFNDEHNNRLTIQIVPKTIYKASYPCWFLDYDQIISAISEQYDIINEYYNEHTIQLDGKAIRFRGLFGKLKHT